MFCINCGEKLQGKYCSRCGMPNNEMLSGKKLGDLFNEWKSIHYCKIKPHTADGYNTAWKYLKCLWDKDIHEISYLDWQQTINQHQHLSYSSLHILQQLCSHLSTLGIVAYGLKENYAKYVVLPPNKKKQYEIFSDSEIITLYNYSNDLSNARCISLFLSCTGRVCVAGSKAWEYGNLRWCLDILKKEDATFLVPFSYKKEHLELGKLLNRDSLFFPMLNADMFSRIPANKEIHKKLCQSVYFDGKKKASVKK